MKNVGFKLYGDYAIISHEIKTPLALIKNNSQLIRRFCEINKLDVKKFNAFSNNIIKQCDVLTKILNNLIDLSFYNRDHISNDSGQTDYYHKIKSLKTEMVDVVELCSEISENSKQYFDNINSYDDLEEKYDGTIEIKFQKADKIPNTLYLECDKVKIERIIMNLISNGLKYNNQKNKKIDISLAQDEEYIIFKIKDNGNGVSEQYFDKIFEPFVRLECDRYDCYNGGCGIGLSIVKIFVDLHNGKLELTSEVGIGSQFTVKIPKIQEVHDSSNNFVAREQTYNLFDKQILDIEFSDIQDYLSKR